MSEHLVRDLFGGAITAVSRRDLLDASDVREVPDNQEVFSYPTSDISIIVEVLERVDLTDPHDAIRFHFDALAYDNSATSSTVDRVTIIPNDRGGSDCTPSAIVLTGVQSVPKFQQSVPDEVRIFMALFRVDWKNADLVTTFNAPILSANRNGLTPEEVDAAYADFDAFVRNLVIVDDGLFG